MKFFTLLSLLAVLPGIMADDDWEFKLYLKNDKTPTCMWTSVRTQLVEKVEEIVEEKVGRRLVQEDGTGLRGTDAKRQLGGICEDCEYPPDTWWCVWCYNKRRRLDGGESNTPTTPDTPSTGEDDDVYGAVMAVLGNYDCQNCNGTDVTFEFEKE